MPKNIWTVSIKGTVPLRASDATQHQLLELLHHWRSEGRGAALVVITAIEGRTSRAVGTLMAVSASGDVVGSISGGCFDAAVVAEAQSVLAEGCARSLRLGAGSPWIDIKLPCGGGLNLLILPDPDTAMLSAAISALARREQHGLQLAEGFALTLQPRLRLMIAGNGGEVPALATLARGIDADVLAISPEKPLLDALSADVDRLHLATPHSLDGLVLDRWTAVVTFFHDHDWEPPLLQRALESEAFFVGAMGSLATHEARCAALAARGVDEATIARIASPLGLFGPARDPQSLAVSALAQILAVRPC